MIAVKGGKVFVDKAQVVVVGYVSPEFSPALQRMRADQMIIDLARIGGHETLAAGTTRGVSNELAGTDAAVSLAAGTLLVIRPGVGHR